MLDPSNIINYKRTDAELEELVIFLVCVAGKKATTVVKQMEKAFGKSPHSLFTQIRALDRKNSGLEDVLREHGFGQYTRLTRAFRALAYGNLNLRTCSLEDLMSIHGIGRKSASCFLAWTRPNQSLAMLDTHLLKYLRRVQEATINCTLRLELRNISLLKELKKVNIPKSTPSSKKLYDFLEQVYLRCADEMGLDPTEMDLQIWREYSE